MLGFGLALPRASLVTPGGPTLSLNFVGTQTLDPQITFTRASSATYFDSAGVLQTATTNTPRFDYNPSTLAARGLLIEEARTNSLAYSQEFNDAYWTKSNSTVTADAIAAPDGTTTADKLIANATTNLHTVFRSVSFTSGTTYTLSVFAKAAEYQYLSLSAGNQATFPARVTFDLVSGTVSSTVSGVGSVENVGNGWFRCSVVATATASASTGCNIAASSTGSYVAYLGDDISGIYIWGAQLETGAFPTSYIPTVAAAVTRSADVASVNTLSPWFNATEGTLFAEGTVVNNIAGTTARHLGYFSDAGVTNVFSVEVRSSTSVRARILTGGVTVSASDSVDVLGVNAKVAGAYAADGATICVNGRSPVTLASSLPSGLTKLSLGQNSVPTAASTINGYLRRITYYPRRLSNAELQTITA